MVFGWQRSSSRRPKETKLVRAATTAAAMPQAAGGRASGGASIGRRTSLPARATPPAILATPLAGPVAEDGCEVVPQFFPGYQTSPMAAAGYARGSPASACFPGELAGGAQRRAGSVRVGGGSVVVERAAAGRRRSDGSTLSNAETLVHMHNSPGCAPVFSTQDPMHAYAGYYSARQPQMQHMSAPLRNDRRASTAASTGMPSDVRSSDPPSPADACGLGGHRRASAVILPASDHEYYPPHSASPARQYSAKYYAGSQGAAMYADEGRPGSYANRRRGDSIGGSSAGGCSIGSSVCSSATVSPASPAEFYYDCYASAPAFAASQLYHGQRQQSPVRSQYYADSTAAATAASGPTLHRNNTTKTMSHNDLALDCRVMDTAGRRRLSPSRSVNFAGHAPHSMHYATSLPSTPEGMVIDNVPAIPHLVDELRPSLSGHCGLRQSAVSVATTASATEDQLNGLCCDDADTVDLVSTVAAVGRQHAYLPPRSTTLTITN